MRYLKLTAQDVLDLTKVNENACYKDDYLDKLLNLIIATAKTGQTSIFCKIHEENYLKFKEIFKKRGYQFEFVPILLGYIGHISWEHPKNNLEKSFEELIETEIESKTMEEVIETDDLIEFVKLVKRGSYEEYSVTENALQSASEEHHTILDYILNVLKWPISARNYIENGNCYSRKMILECKYTELDIPSNS